MCFSSCSNEIIKEYISLHSTLKKIDTSIQMFSVRAGEKPFLVSHVLVKY